MLGHAGNGEDIGMTMIGVPQRPQQQQTPVGRREREEGGGARGWQAILLVLAGFAAILAALYLL